MFWVAEVCSKKVQDERNKFASSRPSRQSREEIRVKSLGGIFRVEFRHTLRQKTVIFSRKFSENFSANFRRRIPHTVRKKTSFRENFFTEFTRRFCAEFESYVIFGGSSHEMFRYLFYAKSLAL